MIGLHVENSRRNEKQKHRIHYSFFDCFLSLSFSFLEQIGMQWIVAQNVTHKKEHTNPFYEIDNEYEF